MTRIRSFTRFAAVLLLVVLAAAPAFAGTAPARGSADFTRFVVIGDSYGAGLESGSLNENHQVFSWPAVIARQAGAPDFQQPLVTFPGIGSELQLVDILHYPPTIAPATGTATPINLNLPRPYNNLSVPGATVHDVITITGAELPTSTSKLFATFILRKLGTEVQQAIALHPTFIAIWIGGNDALGAVLAGNTAALTPLDKFTADYNSMLDQLIAGAPNAGIVVGNIPDNILALPYATTIPPILIDPATQKPVIGPDGGPIPYIADFGGGNVGPLPLGSVVLLPAASLIGSGYGLPPALASIAPFNQLPNVGKPLPPGNFLTPDQLATIKQRVDDFNTAIEAAAGARSIPVADIRGLFNDIADGMTVGPMTLNASFITGGVFSLDGFHMTDIGYTLFADQYIKTINQAYGTQIPLAGLAGFLQNNEPITKLGMGMPVFTPQALQQILMFVPAPEQHKRLRAAGQ